MDKLHAYKALFEIKSDHSVDIDQYTRQLAKMRKDESIPIEVLKFINEYKPLPSFETVNYLHENCKSNRLYRRLVNENQSTEDKVLALTSFLNQCTIKFKSLSENYERKDYIDNLKLLIIIESLQEYFKNGNENAINEAFDLVRKTVKSISRGGTCNE